MSTATLPPAVRTAARRRRPRSPVNTKLDITDLFCGAGGSGLGARAAGYELVIAANHWQKAIDTHTKNFPDTKHDCADISQVNPRRYPRTRVLWVSPECTNHTNAKGIPRSFQQPDLFGDTLPDEAAERSRATMWDVPRFAEVHLYDAIIVENVVEAALWVMFSAWLMAMQSLGYEYQLVYLNSMHAEGIEAPRAPQSRDRLYVVFHRKGARRPQVTPSPLAWCESCSQEVRSVQSWKRPERPWGRYRAQYIYRCPNQACRMAPVEPYVMPVSTAIDWTMPGERLGDKPIKKFRNKQTGEVTYGPLAPRTMNRIATGYIKHLPEFAAGQGLVVPVEGRDGVSARSTGQPARTQTTRLQDALLVPYYGSANTARPAWTPIGTLTAVDRYAVTFISTLRGWGASDLRYVRGCDEPLSTVAAGGNHHMLVQSDVNDLAQAATLEALGNIESLIADCYFRMFEPSEIQLAMAFGGGYHVLGNRREQVRQLGNGVTPPAAEILLRAVAESLDAVAA
jgi:DNA (cytosine-5)-methyltransferase 1